MGFFRHSALAWRVLVWVLSASLAVFALATGFGFVHERAKALEAAHADAHDTAQQTVAAISTSLWQYDVQGLQALLTGVVASRVVVRAEVLGLLDKPLADVRQPGFTGAVDRVWTLPVLAQDQTTTIGTLRISESYQDANAQVADTLKTLVLTDLIKIVGLALVLFAIVYRKIARPLHGLAQDVTRLGATEEAPRLTLARRSGYRDEVDVLVDAINRFLRQRSDEMRLRSSAESALVESRERHRALSEAAFEAIFISEKGVCLEQNAQAERLFGYTLEQAKGRMGTEWIAPADRELVMQHIAAGYEQPYEVTGLRKDGSTFPAVIHARMMHYRNRDVRVTSMRDISEQVRAQAQIDTLAFYDPLTQLPNRRLLLDRLEQALHVSTRHARKNALLFVDLDNFKTLNDTLGHHQGDLLLVQVAHRLKTCIREGDTVAHLGSDEFVVMLEDMSEDQVEAATQAEAVGDKILAAFVPVFALDQASHHGSASMGITLFGGEPLESSEQPLKRAELAMFQAKAAGRSMLRFFDARMQAEVSARAALEADLREAIGQNQFVLHYQPQVVGAGRVTGVEALVRWQHPQRGMVPPAAFIPLAEESGLILTLGQWVLQAACIQLAAWATQPELAQLTMAVNVSALQFRQTDFVDRVLATLASTQAPPRLLKLELTESMLVDDVEAIITKMGALKSRGVGFSLDDFGTGYSSLAYLKRLPLDQLKIDQGFVRNIVTDSNDAAIAKMVVALAESMGLAVIAEGVELQAQADVLAHMGCHAYQGYLFSRPLPREALEAFARQAA
jgi:diguanylate cyclase (GGDEF)-like protein/PAS domain S-box-containing protein